MLLWVWCLRCEHSAVACLIVVGCVNCTWLVAQLALVIGCMWCWLHVVVAIGFGWVV